MLPHVFWFLVCYEAFNDVDVFYFHFAHGQHTCKECPNSASTGKHSPLYFKQVDPWISSTLYSYAPVIMLIATSSVLIIRLNQMKKKRREMTAQQTEKARNEDKITVMVIVICITYVILTTPVTIWFGVASNAGLRVYFGNKIMLGANH